MMSQALSLHESLFIINEILRLYFHRYNQGHLMTAFHLDATLMLSEPTEFDSALKALFGAQEQAMQAKSAAAGEHLCFVGEFEVVSRLLF